MAPWTANAMPSLLDYSPKRRRALVYVTAFPNRAFMSRYLGEIAWETEVWVADAPSHLIHFNGERFLGPYSPAINGA